MDVLEKTLDKILAFEEENEILYREILERIDVYREAERGCNRLVVWFQSLPFGIRLKSNLRGRGKNIIQRYWRRNLCLGFPD